MQLVATGLLVLMAGTMVASVALKARWPWLAWVAAFAEAATVGALADWFAVVALFRHPLGLPIPHTAIIPRNKDRIGTELGLFVEQNFLTPANIVAKLTELDLIGHAARWLAEPANSRTVAAMVRGELPRVLAAIDDAEVERFIGKTVVSRIDKLDAAKLTSAVLGAATANGRHQRILDQALSAIGGWLDQNRKMIKAKVGEQSRLTPGFFDGYIANRFVDGIIDMIGEIGADPEHEIRLAFDGFLQEFIDKLQHEPDYREQADRIKRDILQQLTFERFFALITLAARVGVGSSPGSPRSSGISSEASPPSV